MSTRLTRLTVLVTAFVAAAASADPLPGSTGGDSGDRWQASWLDVKPTVSFKKGETLKVKVEGDAENFLVRLLPSASPYSSSDGIEGKTRKMPANGVLEVKLERDHPNVKQVSLHAGKEAWGKPLGGNNGTIRLISIDRSAQ